MIHHCHAIGCERAVPPRLLMCAPHWRQVPGNLQRLIWRSYVKGQEIRKDPTALYLVAQAHVVAYVASLAGGPWSADRAVEHVMATIEPLVLSDRLTLEDVEVLHRYDPAPFAPALAMYHSIIARRAHEAMS